MATFYDYISVIIAQLYFFEVEFVGFFTFGI